METKTLDQMEVLELAYYAAKQRANSYSRRCKQREVWCYPEDMDLISIRDHYTSLVKLIEKELN